MARRFAKALEEEIEEAFVYPSDLLNTKTTIPLRVGEEPSGDSCVKVRIAQTNRLLETLCSALKLYQ